MGTKSKTFRVKIKDTHITEAAKKAAAGMPAETMDIYSDESIAGLQLRVQAKRAFWLLKHGKNFSKNIGEVASPKPMTRQVPSVKEARDLATSCKKVIDSDPDLIDSVLNRYFEDPLGERNFEVARTGVRRKAATWTLQKCFDFVIEDRTKSNAIEPIGELYADELRLSLRRPQMEDVLGKPAVELTRGDFDAIREGIRAQNGVSPANKTLSHVRMVLDYCMRKASKDSGLDHKDEWWKLIESAGAVKKRNRVPTVDDIVKILIVAEEYLDKPLPGRTDGKHGVRANVYAGLWWLVLTAQRTYAAIHLPRHSFFQDKSGEAPSPEWYLAAWPDEVTKTEEFILPIPPRVVAHMKPLMEAAKTEGSEWAFPSERGSADNDIALASSAVRQFLQRLRAKDPLMNKDGKRNPAAVDFFEKLGVPWWSPHDLRRAIGLALDKAGIPGGASAVLAHKIKLPDRPMNDRQREAWLEQHVEDITRAAYYDPVHLGLKSKAMLVWTNAILDRYEELHPRHRQAKRVAAAERVLRAISSDAAAAEQARKIAMKTLPEVRKRLEATLLDHEQMLAWLKKKAPAPVNDIRTALIEVEIAKTDLDAFNANPASYAIEASRATGVRGLHSALTLPTDTPVDLEKDAPAYTQLRDSYISGQIDYDAFKRAVVERYPITLDAYDDRTFVRPVTGDEVL